MGDVLHTLPALTEAGKHHPGICFDWVVEEAFAEIPTWHPLVNKVIPIALRKARKKPGTFFKELIRVKQQLSENYDYVIDAQGLLKSAFLTLFTHGLRCGGDWYSARESMASLFYQKKVMVDRNQHAVTRMRKLFAAILGYPYIATAPEYDLNLNVTQSASQPYVVFLHGTTWDTKHWPESYWFDLAKIMSEQGFKIKLLWGNENEKRRALRLSEATSNVEVMPKMNLRQIADLLTHATSAVAVDTGLAHLAAALEVPMVSVYGPTDHNLTGALGKKQLQLQSQYTCSPCLQSKCKLQTSSEMMLPCFVEITPARVAQTISQLRELNYAN